MKYKYKNLKKHCVMHGMPPEGYGIFDHSIEGGAIELVETIDDKPKKRIKGDII